jgi:PAS domain S-box-containing protein/putative nucleotidyltransferase with HDIG domain
MKKHEPTNMFRSIFENSVEGIYLISPENRFITANPALAHILGYESPEELITNITNIGEQWYVQPGRHEIFLRLIQKIDAISGFESQVYRKDGSMIWISENVCVSRDTEGKVLYYRGSVNDITLRKREEEAIRESEKNLRIWADKAEQDKYIFLDIIDEIHASYKSLEDLFMGFVRTIVYALEERRPWMKGHSERVAAYSMKIANEMGLGEAEKKKLRLAALLHDIGEFFTLDYMIEKPRLTDSDLHLIRRHPVLGEIILKRIKQLHDIIPLIRHHHERVDGTGYPDGLKGEEIPIGARILHLADSFDSMTVERPYRNPAPGKEYAFLEFKKGNNTQFDPQVAEVALKVL